MREPTIVQAHTSHVKVKFWSTGDWTLAKDFDLPAKGTYALAFSSDGEAMAIGVEYRVLVFSVANGALLKELAVKAKGVYSVAFSPDGHWLASASADKRFRVWERG